MPQIRYATLEDAAAISAMATSTFSNTYAAYNTPEDMEQYIQQHFSLAHIQNELADENVATLLATDNNSIMGYAKVAAGSAPNNVHKGKALEIARLYAVTAHIGKGIGKLLIEHCFEHAKKVGAQYIWLGVWQQNIRAIRFYKQFGFQITGSYTFVLGNDEQQDYIMELVL